MSIKLNGSSAGSVSFDAPSDTSPSGTDVTLTLPTSAGSAGQYLRNSGTAGTLEFGTLPTQYQTQLSTSQTTTSGSAVDFVIPSWAQRITVMSLRTSVSGSAQQYVQIGSGGTPVTTGYHWYGAVSGAATVGFVASTGFLHSGNSPANQENTKWVIQKYEGNTWSAFMVSGTENSGNYYGIVASGHVALSGTLDIVRFGTASTFDAGEVNVFVEG